MLPIDMEHLRTITEKNLRFSFETLLILYLEQFAELCLEYCFGCTPPSKKCSVHMHYSFVLSKQCFLATKGVFLMQHPQAEHRICSTRLQKREMASSYREAR